ncbi:MAG: 50S ribosomal protein L35 [Phycisphaerales bacterium]|nr:50S ribosomal protein L35 [Phycisphaerales bacterium]
MPKIKPHKGLKSRTKVSAKGKVIHKGSGSSHLMSGKSGRHCQKIRRLSIFKGKFNVNALRALGLD